MASKIALSLLTVLLLCLFDQTEGSCSSSQIRCRTGTQCVSFSHVCNGRQQCTDGSDEDHRICSFWTYDSQCSNANFYCSRRGSCYDAKNYCSSSYTCAVKDSRICELVQNGKLELKSPEEAGMALTEQLVELMTKAVNASVAHNSLTCPLFYTQVGDSCVSFFSPAKIPWAEARQFCLSIRGDLLSVKDWFNYEQLLQYMRVSELTTDYWIGGRYDLDVNAWAWVTDESAMPMGSPYWAARYSSSCVPRSPPHTDPFTDPAAALPGAPCYHYQQGPAKRTQGWCAAMTYEHYYYFTDEVCQDNRSPLCIYIKKSEGKDGNNTL